MCYEDFIHFLDPNFFFRMLDLEVRITDSTVPIYEVCEIVVFRHMENLQHQLLVTPTLVPLSASLTARNRTHAHVVKPVFSLSLVCFSLLVATTFWFFMRLWCFFKFLQLSDPLSFVRILIRIWIRFRICTYLSINKQKNFQTPDFNCFMTSMPCYLWRLM